MTIAILLLALFSHFLPSWTRPDLFFAVTVDPEFRRSDASRRILHRYWGILWSTTAVSIVLLLATGLVEFVAIQIAGFLVAMAWAQRQTLAHAAAQSPVIEVDLAAPKESFPAGPLVPLMQLGALVAAAVWASRHWDQLPVRIPVHWGLQGADRWAPRTPMGVYGFLAAQAIIAAVLDLFAWGILHWSRRASLGRSASSRDRRFRELNVWFLLATSCVLTAQAWIVLAKPAIMNLTWPLIAGLLAVYLIEIVRLSRSAATAPAGDGTPDACWKLGIIYYNPADPSMFIPKRFGIGYTVNFANRWTWAIMIAVLISTVAGKLLKGAA